MARWTAILTAMLLATTLASRLAHATEPASTVQVRCERPLPMAARPEGFRRFANRWTHDSRDPRHRGFDVFVRAGEAQWVTAEFAYDVRDSRLEGEDVDVYLLRDCARW